MYTHHPRHINKSYKGNRLILKECGKGWFLPANTQLLLMLQVIVKHAAGAVPIERTGLSNAVAETP